MEDIFALLKLAGAFVVAMLLILVGYLFLRTNALISVLLVIIALILAILMLARYIMRVPTKERR
ncbi:MAG: hypothetical protein JSV58_01730 [Candidatus Bathyarchaeota archaeon]|nr:MAG: hypothetical protein JSV58_01730 [Candidatus Bathyarchaeota archaeon]